MSAITTQDRADLCTFTFADGRQCRSPRASMGTPRSSTHLYLCTFHARKEAQAQAADKLGREVSYFFSGEYLSACDLSIALGRLFPAVVQGHIKPKTASTLAYLAQTLVQTIQLAQHEFTNACGNKYWEETVRESLDQNLEYRKKPTPPRPPQIQAPAPAPPPQQLAGNDQAPEPPLQPAITHEPSPD
jgi:hypothetical protein